MNSLQLNQANLKKISPQIKTPVYSREALRHGIVHIGLGNFHRSHQAFFLDTLISKGLTNSGIFEINLIADTFPLAKIAAEQDYLYTLIAKGASSSGNDYAEARVIGSIMGYVNALEHKEEAIAHIANAETSLVTLTITEKGYFRKAGDLDWNHPAITHDIQNVSDPVSIYGFLAAALSKRAAAGGEPLTIMSCDNFPSNGKILKESLLFFCARIYPDLSSWIIKNVSFPCSMVDRITPNTSPLIIEETEQIYGIADKWPVCCEDFIQWVLEDDFKIPENAVFNPKLFAAAGVQLVKDVEAYELMKMRLLNGSHSALAYLSYLMGYTQVADAASDHLIQKFLRQNYMEEVTPTIPPVPGIDLTVYKDTLITRFKNRKIGDAVLRLAEDGSQKIPNFVLKPLVDTIRNGTPHDAIVLALAGWARFLAGNDETGKPIPVKDPEGRAVSQAAKRALDDPETFFKTIGLKDTDKTELDKLASVFTQFLKSLYKKGAGKTLEDFIHAL